jgi:hypothetical protein
MRLTAFYFAPATLQQEHACPWASIWASKLSRGSNRAAGNFFHGYFFQDVVGYAVQWLKSLGGECGYVGGGVEHSGLFHFGGGAKHGVAPAGHAGNVLQLR